MTELTGFLLIETMRVSHAGEVYLLERHLQRLSNSARHFSISCDLSKTRDTVVEAAIRAGSACGLRLTLAPDGTLTLKPGPLPSGYVQTLKLSSVRVNSENAFLYHKTTNRDVYDEARRECDERTDAILINERGEITETTIMNVAVLRDGRWVTPMVSCGLLAGVMREELLARGEIAEGVIRADELRTGEIIRCFNAMRGTFEVPVCLVPLCLGGN